MGKTDFYAYTNLNNVCGRSILCRGTASTIFWYIKLSYWCRALTNPSVAFFFQNGISYAKTWR
ncbi:hypothetical protein FDUTEX481_06854 [Tolypothrix sp. PCC 7601]|nr:hypothetical protein FDUTEX481_06854 [Tolypothrix sp. PCC 7601]